VNPLEWVAAALGLINVALVISRSVWNYPFGILMVGCYFFVFYDARLYSDALLQIFFLAVQLYGWRNWLRTQGEFGEVVVERLTWKARSVWLGATSLGCLGWGALMGHLTDAVLPFADAAIAGLSVSAQLLLSIRRIESWLLWIGVDLLAVGVFASRGLVVTTCLYALFLVMAVIGLLNWRRAELRQAAR
jgi:nicotinamide mononucleotide transporter